MYKYIDCKIIVPIDCILHFYCHCTHRILMSAAPSQSGQHQLLLSCGSLGPLKVTVS